MISTNRPFGYLLRCFDFVLPGVGWEIPIEKEAEMRIYGVFVGDGAGARLKNTQTPC